VQGYLKRFEHFWRAAKQSKMYEQQYLETRDALLHTQNVLRDFQVKVGYLDRNSGNVIDRDQNIESILLVSPPKAAGSYIMNTLLSGLSLEQRWVSLGYFGSPDFFKVGQLNSFWQDRGCISFIHSEINPFNLHLLKQTDLKIILNIRDPRQCINSLVHYNLIHFPRQAGILHPAQPPDDFPEWSFHEQVDWLIDKHMKNYIDWIEGWLSVADSEDVEILIVTYDQLIKDEKGFFDKILNFYQIDSSKFNSPKLALNKEVNFRSGNPDEWKAAFLPAHIDKCNVLLPNHLVERFNWDISD